MISIKRDEDYFGPMEDININSPPLKMKGLYDIVHKTNDSEISSESSDDLQEMLPKKSLTTRVKSEWFMGADIDFADQGDIDNEVKEQEPLQAHLYTGAYYIGKDNSEK